MLVLVDVNELSTAPHIVDNLRLTFPDLEVSNLSNTPIGGDIQIVLDNGKVLVIERKEMLDLLGSIASGHLEDQVERMSKANFSAIFVFGSLSFTESDMAIVNGKITKWHGASVRGAMYAVQYSACPIIHCNVSYYGNYVQKLIDFVMKPAQKWQSSYRRIVTFPYLDDRVDLIANMPLPSKGVRKNYVGVERATSLLEFSASKGAISIAEALSWACALVLIKPDDWPKGWGKTAVKGIRETMGLKDGEYLEVKRSTTGG